MTNKISKKTYGIIAAVVLVVILGILLCCGCCKTKIGYVDTQAVVSRSEAFRNLQIEQQLKAAELEKWLAESDKELKKLTSPTQRKEKLAKLQAELAQKQLAMQAEFASKASPAEEEVMALINKVASKKCIKVVLAKAAIVSGGVDLTEDVLALMSGDDETEEEAKEEVSADKEEPVETKSENADEGKEVAAE
jgi:outer membrane protein